MIENELDCPIVEVTVYRSEVDIKRTGKIHLSIGLQKVIVPNVSSKLNQDSIRVNGRGFGSILSTDIKSKLGERTKNPEIISLLDELEKLYLEKATLEAEKTALEQKKEGLLSLWNKTTHEEVAHFLRRWAMGKIDIEKLKTLETHVFQDFSTKLLGLNNKLKKLQEKIDDKTEQLELLNAREREQTERLYDVIINVDVEQESDFEFDITYRIYDSYWHPTYDITLESESAKVEQFVLVRNSTFESWNNTYVTLSTVSTSVTSIQDPEPYYLYLGTPYVAKPAKSARRDRFEAEKKVADIDAMDDALAGAPFEEEPARMPPPAPDLKVVEAELRSEGEVQVFKLPERVTIPPDGEPHGFLAQIYELSFKREFYWDAYLSNEVIELLKIKNGDVTLLPGRAKVFEGSDFIGATNLPKIAPSEEFDAGARVSPTIKAEKKLMEREVEKTGLVGKKSTRYYKYQLKIENLREQNSLITVYDRIPKSQSEEVEVEIKSMKPEPKEKRLGIHKWEIEVPAKSKFFIEYDFVVEFPRGQSVYPLP
ncbi:MAG: mucoidy inhibitor MuiA family protein [Promethearchaeota archaeon]